MAILQKEALAGYLLWDYTEKHQRKISPIKLQKGLYLLYAFWAQFANKLNKNGEGVSEIEGSYKLDLFDASFEAWEYGSVDRELYQLYNSDSIKEVTSKELFLDIEDTIVTFINDMLSQLYLINDFSLVDLLHEDNAWRSVYSKYPNGDGKMINQEIINEYILRESFKNQYKE